MPKADGDIKHGEGWIFFAGFIIIGLYKQTLIKLFMIQGRGCFSGFPVLPVLIVLAISAIQFKLVVLETIKTLLSLCQSG